MLALAALLAGCGGDEDVAVARPPDGAIEVEDETYPLGLGTSCWRADEDAAALCVDAAGIVTTPPYAETAPGATLEIAGDLAAVDVPVVSARLWPAPDETVDEAPGSEAWAPPGVPPAELEASDGTLTLPDDLEQGRYLLAIDVHDAETRNTATYGAILEIRERGR